MNTSTIKSILLALFAGIFATGCYTQLETVERGQATYNAPASTSTTTQQPQRQRPQEPVRTERPERAEQIVNEEDYELGYEDGWEDAESYFFKDYETEQWYNDQGATLSHGTGSTVINNYYGYNDPFYSSPYYYSHYPYYRHYGYPTFRYGFSFSIGWGWAYSPYRFYDPFYTVYPGGFYYGG